MNGDGFLKCLICGKTVDGRKRGDSSVIMFAKDGKRGRTCEECTEHVVIPTREKMDALENEVNSILAPYGKRFCFASTYIEDVEG